MISREHVLGLFWTHSWIKADLGHELLCSRQHRLLLSTLRRLSVFKASAHSGLTKGQVCICAQYLPFCV